MLEELELYLIETTIITCGFKASIKEQGNASSNIRGRTFKERVKKKQSLLHSIDIVFVKTF
jgi:hypothetical protein